MKIRRIDKIYLGVFLVLTIPTIIFSLYLRGQNLDPSSDAASLEPTIFDSTFPPRLSNVPPGTAYVGEVYRYEIRFNDADSDLSKIRVDISDGPDWLSKVDDYTIYGIPTEKDKGSARVVLSLSDESSTNLETFYILVATRSSGE
ncbi:hypothetical protein KC622_01705 [Candidatus Dojkabacteria bacterium]|uniref:Dystroglycan-type cadherin-like domain-containing protein n=1 Tax=Candidatus Dojkabacteria bacterium TaxID=2099670 RepID=A0A955HXV5_9BACT|nr:hypothetical protein [Candidatus Dojkabacteria bacterium]MCB9790907.1 hypothetical protein [Candidatus Nomurabacteria bacterium]